MNKGMPIWERHIEKIVLALTVVVLLGVAAMFFSGSNQSFSRLSFTACTAV